MHSPAALHAEMCDSQMVILSQHTRVQSFQWRSSRIKCTTGLKSQMELLATPGSLAWLPLSCYCPFDKIILFLHVTIKKQDKYGRENARELQPHKLFRCRFATDGIKGFNNMEQAMENAKLQHCCSCPELFRNCLGAVLSPSDSQTVGHKNQ